MPRLVFVLFALSALCGCQEATAEGVLGNVPDGYQQRAYDDVIYHVFTADPADVSLHQRDQSGDDLGTLAALRNALVTSHREPLFLTNSGIYETTGQPTGLHIQRGQAFTPLNLENSRGNFFLKPNGVFFIEDGRANVVKTEDFQKISRKPTLAVQSGPFYEEGVHPKLTRASKSKKMRNGVGINKAGKVVFVATVGGQDRLPSLRAFGHAMRSFGAIRSIYLDGNISRVSVAGMQPEFQPVPFVGMLAVTKAKQ